MREDADSRGSCRRKVFLVDDHPIVRQALAQLIAQEPDFVVCGESGDIQGSLKAIAETRPDIVVADLSLTDGSGIRLIEEMNLRWPGISVLVLSMFDEAAHAERCLRAGAKGYVMKNEPPGCVIEGLRKIARGGLAVSDNVSSDLLSGITGKRGASRMPVASLTNRELEVFQLVGRGLPPSEIAVSLHLSVKTINTHIERIKKKLHLPDYRSLIVRASSWAADELPSGTRERRTDSSEP